MILKSFITNQMNEKKAIKIADGLFRLLDIEWVFGEDYPGVVGVQVVAGEERHATEVDAYIAFPNAFT